MFYIIKLIGKGIGLGFYILFFIVEVMGGIISVESEVNVGIIFILFFLIKLEDKKIV